MNVLPVSYCVVAVAVIALMYYFRERMGLDVPPQNRLLHPLFSDVEARLGCPVPSQIVKLYGNHKTILRTDFYILDPIVNHAAWLISYFIPVDTLAIKELWPPIPDVFVFAKTMTGDCYFVPTRIPPGDLLPVFILYEDSQTIVKVAESIDDFLQWPRIEAVDYHRYDFPGE